MSIIKVLQCLVISDGKKKFNKASYLSVKDTRCLISVPLLASYMVRLLPCQWRDVRTFLLACHEPMCVIK